MALLRISGLSNLSLMDTVISQYINDCTISFSFEYSSQYLHIKQRVCMSIPSYTLTRQSCVLDRSFKHWNHRWLKVRWNGRVFDFHLQETRHRFNTATVIHEKQHQNYNAQKWSCLSRRIQTFNWETCICLHYISNRLVVSAMVEFCTRFYEVLLQFFAHMTSSKILCSFYILYNHVNSIIPNMHVWSSRGHNLIG